MAYVSIHGQMCLGPEFFDALPARNLRPPGGHSSVRWLRINVETDCWETLEEADEHEWHFIICKLYTISADSTVKWENSADLLSQTDARTSIERNEYERVRNEIFLHAVVQEAIRIEFESWWQSYGLNRSRKLDWISYHLGPTNLFGGAWQIQSRLYWMLNQWFNYGPQTKKNLHRSCWDVHGLLHRVFRRPSRFMDSFTEGAHKVREKTSDINLRKLKFTERQRDCMHK